MTTTMAKTTKKSVAMLVAALLCVAMGACHKEPTYAPKDSEARDYANGWESRFGPIDASQTWNMATQITSMTAAEQSYEYVVACEDLASMEDYDFNDFVFSISHEAGTNTLTLTPLAAGSTLATRLYYNGESLGEVHKLIDPTATDSAGIYKPINTTTRGQAGKPIKLGMMPNFSLSNMGGFAIQVSKPQANGTVKLITLMPPVKGKAPQMLMLPAAWSWPAEGQLIEMAYTKFRQWNQNASANSDWTTNGVDVNYLVK